MMSVSDTYPLQTVKSIQSWSTLACEPAAATQQVGSSEIKHPTTEVNTKNIFAPTYPTCNMVTSAKRKMLKATRPVASQSLVWDPGTQWWPWPKA